MVCDANSKAMTNNDPFPAVADITMFNVDSLPNPAYKMVKEWRMAYRTQEWFDTNMDILVALVDAAQPHPAVSILVEGFQERIDYMFTTLGSTMETLSSLMSSGSSEDINAFVLNENYTILDACSVAGSIRGLDNYYRWLENGSEEDLSKFGEAALGGFAALTLTNSDSDARYDNLANLTMLLASALKQPENKQPGGTDTLLPCLLNHCCHQNERMDLSAYMADPQWWETRMKYYISCGSKL